MFLAINLPILLRVYPLPFTGTHRICVVLNHAVATTFLVDISYSSHSIYIFLLELLSYGHLLTNSSIVHIIKNYLITKIVSVRFHILFIFFFAISDFDLVAVYLKTVV